MRITTRVMRRLVIVGVRDLSVLESMRAMSLWIAGMVEENVRVSLLSMRVLVWFRCD